MGKLILTAFISFAILAGFSAFGQSSAIMGTVLDSANLDPIPFVNIMLSVKGTQAAGTTTDFDGKYKMVAITPGTYDLIATYVGYKVVEIRNLIVGDSVKVIDLKMVATTMGLGEFEVVNYNAVGLISRDQTSAGYIPGVQVSGVSSQGKIGVTGNAPKRDFESDAKFQAGQLTVSEINDFYKWDLWKATVAKKLEDNWHLYPENRYSVQVKGKKNMPVADAAVELLDNSGTALWKSRTDNTGKAELWSGMTDGKDVKARSIRVTYENETYTYKEPHVFKSGINVMVLPVECKMPETIDIMFVVDATGSMSDEIDYLKRELDDILSYIENTNPAIVARTASLFYCADGNQRETFYSDFTTDQSVTSAIVKTQVGDCGGEECVDKAFEVAVNLNWSESSHARLMFFMLDAPPFRDSLTIKQLQGATKRAAEKGIRVIPVVASAEEMYMALPLEYLMRSVALATNGTYLFLTDHSQIGNEHAKPVTDSYDVEILNDAIKRVINQYTYYPPCDMVVEQGISDTTVLFAKKIIAHEVIDSTLTIASVTPPDRVVVYTADNVSDTVQIVNQQNDQPAVNPLTETPDIPENTPYIKYFPNPTDGELTVLVSGNIHELEVLDISGKLLQTVKAQPEIHLSLSDYSSGIYFIRFIDSGKNVTGKVILR